MLILAGGVRIIGKASRTRCHVIPHIIPATCRNLRWASFGRLNIDNHVDMIALPYGHGFFTFAIVGLRHCQ